MGHAASMSTPVLSIVGRSNSGKTTLLEKLITELTHQGLRIGTIKHSHHQPEMDMPGKDSWRHKKAGAVTSLLIGWERLMMVADVVNEVLSPQLLAHRYFPDVDLVLVEGYAGMEGPKIEVVRAERSQNMRYPRDAGLIAVVTDVNALQLDIPVFGLDDVDAVTFFILNWIGRDC